MRIDGAVALVTGASRGIGRATAIALAARGAKLALTSRNAEELEAVASRIRSAGGKAIALAGDVTERSEVERVVSAVQKRWGRVDILVANAGAYHRRPVLDLSATDIEASLAVNFYGAVHAILAVLPAMVAQGSGQLVLVNSIDGRKALPGDAPYAIAKFALAGLGQALRQELRPHGIRVTTIFPGRVDTAMVSHLAFPRISSKLPPEKIADAIVRAIRRDRTDVIIPRRAAGLLFADLISPRLADWFAEHLRLSGTEIG
jgi:NADP-dependent 3-hydroxy acid dehydrogenase YdfG